MRWPWSREPRRPEPTHADLHRYDDEIDRLPEADRESERRRLAGWDISMAQHAARLGRLRPEWERETLDEWQRTIAPESAERAVRGDRGRAYVDEERERE